MLNENAKKWVAALRSDGYDQGELRLRRGDTFCCLGVLCDVYRRETGKGVWQDDTGFWTFNGESGGLPNDVRDWAGLQDNMGGFNGPGCRRLSCENDNGIPFSAIADLIESEPPGLFVSAD